jgi:uncharacterized membrane-anchored protein YhcB (DUF1043 family)
MSDTTIAGLITGLGVLVSGVIGARHKNSQERDRSALAQYREVADRLQRQVETLQAHVVDQAEAVDQLTEEHTACQVELADLYGACVLLHDFAKRTAACCKRLGDDPGEVPPLPARPHRPDRAAAEFRRRSLQQNTQLLQSKHPLPPAGGTP